MKKGSKKKVLKKPKVITKPKVKINTITPKIVRGDELRRTFNIENITANTIEIAGYVFEQNKIKKLYGLTIDEFKKIRACKSLRII